MVISKYICRCGSRVDRLNSYFYNGIRVTMCDECADKEGFKDKEDIEQIDYEDVKNNYSKQIIDTREK